VTVFRGLLFVLFVGAAAVVLFGLLGGVSTVQLPLVVSGLAVGGVASGILGFSLASAAVRQGETGRGGRALGLAFVGGLFVLGASGALAGAIVLGILTVS
jgi:hypothetical protein